MISFILGSLFAWSCISALVVWAACAVCGAQPEGGGE